MLLVLDSVVLLLVVGCTRRDPPRVRCLTVSQPDPSSDSSFLGAAEAWAEDDECGELTLSTDLAGAPPPMVTGLVQVMLFHIMAFAR